MIMYRFQKQTKKSSAVQRTIQQCTYSYKYFTDFFHTTYECMSCMYISKVLQLFYMYVRIAP